MKISQVIRELEIFEGIQEAGFIISDTFRPGLSRSTMAADELEGLVMRLYFLSQDPSKKIQFFINQYSEGKFLYLIRIKQDAWLFILSADNNFAKLHFFIKYLLSDGELEDDAGARQVQKNDEKLLSAKRIQELLFADIRKATSRFSDHYLWHQPKDFLGGDFYWARESRHSQWIVIGDCTGHSVEGALASVSVMSLLNQVFEPDMSPHMLIKNLHKSLEDIQNQDLVEGYGIGCEMIALKYEFSSNTLYFSSTGLPLLHIGEHFRIIKPKKSFDQRSLLKFLRSKRIALGGEESLMTYSDGVADQISPEGKRMKPKHFFGNLTLDSSFSPQAVRQVFESWKGSADQTDDVILFWFKP